jgi:hypothetical protein
MSPRANLAFERIHCAITPLNVVPHGNKFLTSAPRSRSGRECIRAHRSAQLPSWYLRAESTEERKGHAQEHTSLYYDLVTEFFEYGWVSCADALPPLHLAGRSPRASLPSSWSRRCRGQAVTHASERLHSSLSRRPTSELNSCR